MEIWNQAKTSGSKFKKLNEPVFYLRFFEIWDFSRFEISRDLRFLEIQDLLKSLDLGAGDDIFRPEPKI